MEKKEEMFQYTYSAAQQEEIRKIREKYIPREETKLEQLRRLDRAAGKKGTAFSLTAGIAGCLLFGLGMACTTELSLDWRVLPALSPLIRSIPISQKKSVKNWLPKSFV